MISIAALTLIPLSVPAGALGSDKAHHLLAFAALTLPCAVLYPKALLRVALAAAIFGGAIEVIQPYVGRQGELQISLQTWWASVLARRLAFF